MRRHAPGKTVWFRDFSSDDELRPNPSATSAGQYPWLAARPCPGYASRVCKLWWNASQTFLKAGTNPKLTPSLRQ